MRRALRILTQDGAADSKKPCFTSGIIMLIFQWKQLENLYFRDKKFAVEVHDPRRVPLSRRTFGQSALVVNTWYASTSQIKSIWVMAISQHQFYLDRKQSKAKIPSARSISDIAMDLTDTGTSKASKLATVDGKNPLITTSNGSLISSGSQDSEVSDEQKKEKLIELKQRQSTLQEILGQKMEELKKICLREAELTGKLPKEYPQTTGEEPPHIRRRVGTAFKLDDNLLQTEEDPYLQDVENKFVIQQKIVEAARKLANDPDICKNLKKKRKLDYIDALKKLQEIENASNEYRIKCGRKPTQRASLIVSDEGIPSECSSLSDTNTMDDDDLRTVQRQRSFSSQQTPRPLPPQSLEIKHSRQRRSSTSEQFHDKGHVRQPRYISNEAYYVQDSSLRSHRELSSTHSSPYRTQGRQSQGGRSMPATPVLTRNAYSSSHLRPELSPKHFRQRSGSLESQPNQQDETVSETAVFSLTPAQRSNSTELLDDGSSYTSQSSAEYYSSTNKPHQYYSTMTVGCRSRERRRHKKPNISSATSGSMPNLAPKDGRNGVYQNSHNQPSSDYYIPGYQPYSDFEPCGYTYENDTEGHYNVKAPYRSLHSGAEYYRGYSHFYPDETDSMSQNPYATLRNPRRGGAKNEQITKNIQKALVAESLRGWYERASTHRDHSLQAGLDSYRGSQQSLGFTYMQGPFSTTSRATSFSSVSSAISTGTWRSQHTMGLQEYDPVPYTSSFNSTYSNTARQSRSEHWRRRK